MELLLFAAALPPIFAVLLSFGLRKRGKRGAVTVVGGWTIFVSLFSYMIYQRLDAVAVAQGLENAGIPMAAVMIWTWLALATPAIGVGLIAAFRWLRSRQARP